ncbi:MAG: oligoribonuclease [Wenzhouxiangellaceae bacterium]
MQDRLIWIDLEMTGLDSTQDLILEIATIVTDAQLNELAQGPVLAIQQPLHVLQAMDDWNRRTHTASGLWQRVLDSKLNVRAAELQTLDFLRRWLPAKASPMCGNSICQDRRFMARLMPELEAYFHYRNLDVSTLKELARRWAPQLMDGLVKDCRHEALADIRDSINELRYYRAHMGQMSGLESASTVSNNAG